MIPTSARALGALFAAHVAIAGSLAKAADGQILITHAKAIAGNVTPTDTADYPVTLSRSGSYILGSDLTPGPDRDGIVAGSSDISIDLNGFKISGGPAGGTSNARFGIWGKGDRLTVKNGTITGFESAAINVANRSFLVVEGMRVINSRQGIYNLDGTMARIQNNTVGQNTVDGIRCGHDCLIEGNVVAYSGRYGVYIVGGTVLGNTISNNELFGVYSAGVVGVGNNSMIYNNNGTTQIGGIGYWFELHPNVCGSTPCP